MPDVANLPSILEYLRSMATLVPFVAGAGIGWTVGVYFKKERIDVLEEAKDFLSRQLAAAQKENELLIAELRETRKRTDGLTDLLHQEQRISAELRTASSQKGVRCPICGGAVKRVSIGKNDRGFTYVNLTCEACDHDFHVPELTLAQRI